MTTKRLAHAQNADAVRAVPKGAVRARRSIYGEGQVDAAHALGDYDVMEAEGERPRLPNGKFAPRRGGV